MAHIHTDDEIWAWGGTPEDAIQRMLEPEKAKKKVRKKQVKTSKISCKQLDKLSKKRILEIMHDTLNSLEGYTNKNTINSCLEKAIKGT